MVRIHNNVVKKQELVHYPSDENLIYKILKYFKFKKEKFVLIMSLNVLYIMSNFSVLFSTWAGIWDSKVKISKIAIGKYIFFPKSK